jgi:hypothetical protein
MSRLSSWVVSRRSSSASSTSVAAVFRRDRPVVSSCCSPASGHSVSAPDADGPALGCPDSTLPPNSLPRADEELDEEEEDADDADDLRGELVLVE